MFDPRYLVKMLSFAVFSYILYLYLEMFFDLWVLLKSLFNALVYKVGLDLSFLEILEIYI